MATISISNQHSLIILKMENTPTDFVSIDFLSDGQAANRTTVSSRIVNTCSSTERRETKHTEANTAAFRDSDGETLQILESLKCKNDLYWLTDHALIKCYAAIVYTNQA